MCLYVYVSVCVSDVRACMCMHVCGVSVYMCGVCVCVCVYVSRACTCVHVCGV